MRPRFAPNGCASKRSIAKDAQLLRLLLEIAFRVLGAGCGEPDLRQLLWHRHRLVQIAHAS